MASTSASDTASEPSTLAPGYARAGLMVGALLCVLPMHAADRAEDAPAAKTPSPAEGFVAAAFAGRAARADRALVRRPAPRGGERDPRPSAVDRAGPPPGRQGERTAVVLEEIAHTLPITAGFVVQGARIEQARVLVYRESARRLPSRTAPGSPASAAAGSMPRASSTARSTASPARRCRWSPCPRWRGSRCIWRARPTMSHADRPWHERLRSPWPWHRWLGGRRRADPAVGRRDRDPAGARHRPGVRAAPGADRLGARPVRRARRPRWRLGYRTPLGWVAQAGDRVHLDAVALPSQLGALNAGVATFDAGSAPAAGSAPGAGAAPGASGVLGGRQ